MKQKLKQKIVCLECNTVNTFKPDQEQIECKHCGHDICTDCGGLFKPVYENNGFQAPDPEHWEVTGAECINCGKKI